MKPVLLVLFVSTLSCLLLGISNPGLKPSNEQSLGYQHLNSNSLANPMDILSSFPKPHQGNRNSRLKELIYTSYYTELSGSQIYQKEALFYNSIQPTRIDSLFLYDYNLSELTYVPVRKYFYYYNATGTQVDSIATSCISNDTWSHSCLAYLYDIQNRLVSVQERNYNNNLEPYYAIALYGYDADNLLYRIQKSSTGDEAYYSRTTYSHDEQGRITGYNYETSTDSLNWENVVIDNFTYNTNDTSTEDTYINYLSHEGLLMIRRIYVSDVGFGMLDEIESQEWQDGAYHNFWKQDLIYDNLDRLISSVAYNFTSDDVYVPWQLCNYAYDQNNNLLMLTVNFWNAENSVWNDMPGACHYVWEQYTSIDEETCPEVEFKVSAYPNPFRDAVNINLDSKTNAPYNAAIYNLKGQLVKSFLNQTTKAIVWDGKSFGNKPVGNGIYLLKIKQNGHTTTNKIIRMK